MKLVSLSLIAFLLLASLLGCGTSEEDQRTAHYHFEYGVKMMHKKEFAKALEQLLIARDLDPDNPIYRNNLGVCYYLMGENEHAIVSYERALGLDENYSEAKNNLGRVLIDIKDFNGARKYLYEAAADLTYPHKDKIWLNIGLSYFFEFRYKKSLKFFLKSVAANRKNCLAHAYYGRAMIELQKFNKAAQSLDKAIYHCRGKAFDEPHYYGAIALFRLGKKSLAIARLQEAIKLYPKGPYRKKIYDMLELMQITDSKIQ